MLDATQNANSAEWLEKLAVATARTYVPKLVGFLVLLFIAWIVARIGRAIVRRLMLKAKVDETLTRFVANVVRYVVLTIGIVSGLGLFGIQTATFAAVLGAAGLAVGLAFQGTLSNLAAGVMLVAFRPFKVSDFVRAGGELGTVVEVELFTTELKTPDNRRVIVPNSKIFGETIENFSAHDTRRVDVEVGASYDSDIDATREALLAAVREVDGVHAEPAPVAFLDGFGDSSVDWQVRVWCDADVFWDVKQALVRSIKRTLDDEAIGIPYPQVDVHLDADARLALSGKPSPRS